MSSVVGAAIAALQVVMLLSGGSGPVGVAGGCVVGGGSDAFVCWAG